MKYSVHLQRELTTIPQPADILRLRPVWFYNTMYKTRVFDIHNSVKCIPRLTGPLLVYTSILQRLRLSYLSFNHFCTYQRYIRTIGTNQDKFIGNRFNLWCKFHNFSWLWKHSISELWRIKCINSTTNRTEWQSIHLVCQISVEKCSNTIKQRNFLDRFH